MIRRNFSSGVRRVASLLFAGVMSFTAMHAYTKSSSSLTADADSTSTTVSYSDITGSLDFSNLRFSNFNSSVLSGDSDIVTSTSSTSSYEERTVIVSLDCDNLIESADGENITEYLSTTSGKNAEKTASRTQDKFLSALDEAGIPYELKYKYSSIDVGVAIIVNTSYVSYIKTMDNVTSVVIGDSYAAPESTDDSSSSYTVNATNVYATGIYDSSEYVEEYGGKGMTVAILDTGLDYTHSAFQLTDDPDDYYYSYSQEYKKNIAWRESDVESMMATLDLNARGRLYLSDIVPYAYDSHDRDPFFYPTYSDNGTHVAGIIAGRASYYTDSDGNIVFKDGYDKTNSHYSDADGNYYTDSTCKKLATEEFIGASPYAQLVICKVFTDDLDSVELGGATTEDILAALEDCVTLGVDVINMSLGSTNGFSTTDDGDDEGEYLSKVYNSIGDAGISLVVAASNEYSSGYGSDFGTNLTSNPDSGTVGSPSTYSSALSVASISGKTSPYMIANKDTDNETSVYFRESSDENNVDYDFTEQIIDIASNLQSYFNNRKAQSSSSSDIYSYYNYVDDSNVVKDSDGSVVGLTCSYVVVPGIGQSTDYTTTIKNLINKSHQAGEFVIALVKRGTSTFQDKVEIAMQFGADAVIVYNNVSGEIKMTIGDVEDPVPTVSIKQVAGEAMVSGATSRKGSITINSTYQAGPFMSDFSSWGVTSDLKLKPEITAHGGEITSSVPGGYGEKSGTSMATPNISGLTANILSYIKQNYSKFLGDDATYSSSKATQLAYHLMMSTATTIYDSDGLAYSPRKQGAGLASLSNIINSNAYLYTDSSETITSAHGTYTGADGNRAKIEIGEDENKVGEYTLVFYANNVSGSSMDFTLSSLFMTESLSVCGLTVAEQAYMLDGNAVWTINGTEYHDGDTVTLSGGTTKISCTLTLTDAEKKYLDDSFENGMFVEGFLQLISTSDSQCDLSIPFMGFYGDWESAPMLDYNAFEIAEIEQDTSIDDDEKASATVWATQAYASYWNTSYVLPMGSYLYTQDEDADQIYVSEEHSAVSIYNDETATDDSSSYMTSYAIRGLYAGLLRNAKLVYVTMTNVATGELIYTKEVYRVGKAYAGAGGTTPAYVKLELTPDELGLVENGQYELTFKFYFTGNETDDDFDETNTFSFSFYADYTAPVLEDARIRYVDYKENGVTKQRIYLDLDVYDNHYAMACILCRYTTNSDGEDELTLVTDYVTPVYNATKNGITTVSIEITDIYSEYGNELYLEIDDYALNHSVYKIDINSANSSVLPDTFSLTNASDSNITIGKLETYSVALSWDTTAYPNANISNFTWSIRSGAGIIAVKNGEIVGLKAGSGSVVVSNGSQQITINVTVTDNDNKLTSYPSITFGTILNYQDVPVVASGTVKVNINQEIQLTIEYDPWYYELVDDSLKTQTVSLTWTSSDSSVATVDENGNVTLKKKGKATIMAMIDGTSFVASVTLSTQEAFTVSSYSLTEYTGAGGVVFIPTDMNITSIGSKAFENNTEITAVIIPKTVTSIGEKAFYGCTNLKYVFFYDVYTQEIAECSLNMIYAYAFEGCTSLEYIDFSNCKTFTVAKYAFEGCTSLKVIKGLENCGTAYDEAFANCTSLLGSISSDSGIELFSKVTYNGTEISGLYNFSKETSEKTINYVNIEITENSTENSDTITLHSNGLSSITSQVTSLDISGLHVAGDFVFMNASSLVGLTTDEFTAIGDYMFYCETSSLASKKLNYITIKASSVGEGAFYNCAGLYEVTFDVTGGSIGDYAFACCSNLYEVTFGNSTIKSIGSYAFMSDYLLDEFTLPQGLTSLGADIFYGTDIANLTIAVDLTSVTFTGSTFNYISSISLDDAVSALYVLEGGILYNSTMSKIILSKGCDSEIVIPSTVVEIGNYAFAYTNVSKVTFNDALETIGNGAFMATKLESVTLSNVVTIGEEAFADIETLTSVNLGNALQTIGYASFYGTSLQVVSVPSTVTYIGDIAFAYTTLNEFVFTPTTSATFGDRVLQGNTQLEKVTLGSNIVAMGDYTFALCTSLTQIAMPKLTSLGEGTFYGCTNLTSVTFENGATTLGTFTFYGNSKLTSVTLSDDMTEIGYGAFMYTTALCELDLKNVTTIGEYAFTGDTSLTTLKGLENVTYISGYAFYECTSLCDITISSVEYIGTFAFYGTSATSITIPKTLASTYTSIVKTGEADVYGIDIGASYTYIYSSIGDGAFAGMPYLTQFEVEDGAGFIAVDGVLYRVLSSGNYELVAYPSAKIGASYTVIDNTVRISAYAFAYSNNNLTTVSLPYQLALIGNGAFYSSKVTTYHFTSVVAPSLESVGVELSGDDAYYMIYFGNSAGGIFRGLTNTNFGEYAITLADFIVYYDSTSSTIVYNDTSSLTMSYPENGTGYDAYVYSLYFSTTYTTSTVLEEDAYDFVQYMLSDAWYSLAEIEDMMNWEVNSENLALVTAFSEIVKEAHRLYNNVSSDETQVALMTSALAEGGLTIDTLTETESLLKSVKEKFGITQTISKVSYVSGSYIMDYEKGDEFDMTGLIIVVTYDDYSEVQYTGDSLSLASSSQGALSTLDRSVTVYIAEIDRSVTLKINVTDSSTVVEEDTNVEVEDDVDVDEEIIEEDTASSGCGSVIGTTGDIIIVLASLMAVAYIVTRRGNKNEKN